MQCGQNACSPGFAGRVVHVDSLCVGAGENMPRWNWRRGLSPRRVAFGKVLSLVRRELWSFLWRRRPAPTNLSAQQPCLVSSLREKQISGVLSEQGREGTAEEPYCATHTRGHRERESMPPWLSR